MNRIFSTTHRTYTGAMRYYSNLLNNNEFEWCEYRRSSTYEDDEFDFRMFYNQLKRSKVSRISLEL